MEFVELLEWSRALGPAGVVLWFVIDAARKYAESLEKLEQQNLEINEKLDKLIHALGGINGKERR